MAARAGCRDVHLCWAVASLNSLSCFSADRNCALARRERLGPIPLFRAAVQSQRTRFQGGQRSLRFSPPGSYRKMLQRQARVLSCWNLRNGRTGERWEINARIRRTQCHDLIAAGVRQALIRTMRRSTADCEGCGDRVDVRRCFPAAARVAPKTCLQSDCNTTSGIHGRCTSKTG